MLIRVKFLWNHVDILLAALILVIIVKSIVLTIVVKAFGYSIRIDFVVSILCWWFSISFSPILKCILTLSFLMKVGMSLPQIGEFAFVLLSRAPTRRSTVRPPLHHLRTCGYVLGGSEGREEQHHPHGRWHGAYCYNREPLQAHGP
jgi:predicted Kef-type K+ transport protein